MLDLRERVAPVKGEGGVKMDAWGNDYPGEP